MNIVILGNQSLFCHGLSLLLAETLGGVRVTQARGLDQAIERVTESGNVDLVLLVPDEPTTRIEDDLGIVVKCLPGVPVVTICESEKPEDVRAALRAGARGYIFKSAEARTLTSAIRRVISGRVAMPPTEAKRPDMTAQKDLATTRSRLLCDTGPLPLTSCQKQVLVLLAEGQSNRNIADNLDMAERAIEKQMLSIFKKLGVRNRTQAVVTGFRLGHIPQSMIR